MIGDADTIDGAREIVRGEEPGRYYVDEIKVYPFPSGHTSRAWGKMMRKPDGWIYDERSPRND
jgi:hypothetical protein